MALTDITGNGHEPLIEVERDPKTRKWVVYISRVDETTDRYVTVTIPDKGEWTAHGPYDATERTEMVHA